MRVFLPYYDIERKDIQEVDGRVNPKNGDPMGRCTVRLTNGDEITGSFRPERTLSGMVMATGSNMEAHGLVSISGFHRDGVLHGQGKALLGARSLWPSIDRQVTLEGIFNDSYLEGPVRGAYSKVTDTPHMSRFSGNVEKLRLSQILHFLRPFYGKKNNL